MQSMLFVLDHLLILQILSLTQDNKNHAKLYAVIRNHTIYHAITYFLLVFELSKCRFSSQTAKKASAVNRCTDTAL